MKISTGLLLALYSLPGIAARDDATQPANEKPCRARAWVRAPDLEPGQVVQGDVRVKLDGSCGDVSSYSLGLQFAERSWVKTRRESVKLPERPTEDKQWFPSFPFTSNDSVYEGGIDSMFLPQPAVNRSTWEKYTDNIKDPNLWLVREEERIGFEAKYAIRTAEIVSAEVVEAFAILVPYTNYPPGFDMTMILPFANEADSADSEHIYAYFVDVHFTNGTSERIPAGYTSFNTAIPRTPSEPQTINVTAVRSNTCDKESGCENLDETPRDEFTLEITFPHGRHFESGSTNNITIISHQVGPGLQRPLEIDNLIPHVSQKRRWAAKFAADNKTAKELLGSGAMQQNRLWPEPDEDFFESRFHRRPKPTRFVHWQGDAGTFTTEVIAAQFKVAERCYPRFETYYQTTEVELDLQLQVQNVSSKDVESDVESEYNWIPTPRGKEPYHWGETLDVKVPIFIHPSPEDYTESIGRNATHYLSAEARAPIFVDPLSVMQLIEMASEDRDNLAPLAQASFVTHADSEVVKHRYFKKGAWRGLIPGDGPHYVGDTWIRKVARRERESTSSLADRLVIQAC